MNLNSQNYHSQDANLKYMSSSQYKDFAGTIGMCGCEARALAKLKGEYQEEPSKALLIGSYVDAYFNNSLDKFKNDNPDIFKKDGTLKSDFVLADKMIERINQDDYFLKYTKGETQKILTGNLFDVDWKVAIDFYFPSCIVDLKTCASINKPIYVQGWGRVNFVLAWGYDIQMAIYQKIVEINTGNKLPCYIAAVSKEPEPNIEIIGFDQQTLNDALWRIETDMPRIIRLKNGEEEPKRCGKCDYCRKTKVLTRPIHFSEIELD